MGNTISDLSPTPPLPANTIATSYNRKGTYIIESTLGTGGHGTVYRVIHPQSTKLFAMKVLQTSTSAQLRKFREEATVLASLSHPNVVVLEDIGGVPEPDTGSWNACILTELADHNLLDFHTAYLTLGMSGLDEAVAQMVAFQMLSALTYLHDRRLAHRDVKPANILVFYEINSHHLIFKISDFGLAAHFLEEDENVPAPAARYTAPELLFCYQEDPEQVCKADVWALGQVCRDLCTQALAPPHTGSRIMGSWAKEATDWDDERECLGKAYCERVQGVCMDKAGRKDVARTSKELRKELGLESTASSDEMEI